MQGGRVSRAVPSAVDGDVTTASLSESTSTNDASTQGLNPEQLAFMERKRRAAAGLGPIMPESSYCKKCNGAGLCDCHRCKGSGMNQQDPLEMFGGFIKETSGEENMKWWFIEGGPCWLCRGKTWFVCKDCQGTGFHGAMENFIAD